MIVLCSTFGFGVSTFAKGSSLVLLMSFLTMLGMVMVLGFGTNSELDGGGCKFRMVIVDAVLSLYMVGPPTFVSPVTFLLLERDTAGIS